MQDELYADGVGEITVTGPIVRINLVSLSATEKDGEGNPMPKLRQRVIMSVDGFANTVDLMQKALNGLIEAGAVRRVGTSTSTPAPRTVAPTATPVPQAPNASPNFN